VASNKIFGIFVSFLTGKCTILKKTLLVYKVMEFNFHEFNLGEDKRNIL